MKIIIPMAGRGSRLRPHTLTVPKPLVPVVGKPIVQRLVEDLAKSFGEPIEEIAFIIGDFGDEAEKMLLGVAKKLGAKGSIYYQEKPLGTAHAILCAADSLSGNCIVAFADTLFRSNFKLDTKKDGIIWVKRVPDPSAYGVVQLNNKGFIENFVEKPTTFVSDMAIVGIYYFRDGDNLKSELQYLIDKNITSKGEYQLTDALEKMRKEGKQFFPGEIDEWLDCGNKEAVVHSNQRVLEFNKGTNLVSDTVALVNSTIVQPCFIGEGVVIENSVVGPHVSIGNNSRIENCVIKNSIIQNETSVSNVVLKDSMIGNYVVCENEEKVLSIGDYCKVNA